MKCQRLKAGISHFIISLLIFSIVITLLLYLWYPQPHFYVSGGWQGLKIVAGVDLVLGPLLTAIIFNTDKKEKELIIDVLSILSIQLLVLGWGINTIYQQRPVALVFWDGEFLSVPAEVLTVQKINIDELKDYGDRFPVLIYGKKPTSQVEYRKMLMRSEIEMLPPHHQMELYEPFEQNFSDIYNAQVDIKEILNSNETMKEQFEMIWKADGSKASDYQYYSLRSKYHNAILLFNHSGSLINYVVVTR